MSDPKDTERFFLAQLASMLVRGRDPQYIADSLDRTVKWVEDMALTPEVSKLCQDIRTGKYAEETEEAIWSPERTSLEVQVKTPKALKRLWELIANEATPESTRLKAIEMWLKANDKMPRPVEEAAPELPVEFDDAAWERLKKLEETRATRIALVRSIRGGNDVGGDSGERSA